MGLSLTLLGLRSVVLKGFNFSASGYYRLRRGNNRSHGITSIQKRQSRIRRFQVKVHHDRTKFLPSDISRGASIQFTEAPRLHPF